MTVSGIKVDELFRSETIVVRRVPGIDLSRWVVTFDNHSIGAGFDRPGFGEHFLQREGISAIHVLGRGDDWYQYRGIMRAIKAVRVATAGARRIVAYGSSMGGYAALRLGRRLGADAALALSPQWTINPDKAPWEQRWASDSARIDWLETLDGPIPPMRQAVVAYDPIGDDARHVDAIAAEVPIVPLAIPHGGHPVSTFLAESGLLRPLLVAMLYDSFDAAAFARAARARRGTCVSYLAELSERQPAHRQRLALALARRATAVQPNHLIALTSLGRRLSAAGQHDEAIAALEQAVTLSGRNIGCTVPLAEALAAAGRRGDAIMVAQDVANEHPARGHLRHWLGWLQWRDDRHADAIDSEAMAVQLEPGNTLFAETLRRYQDQGGPGLLSGARRLLASIR